MTGMLLNTSGYIGIAHAAGTPGLHIDYGEGYGLIGVNRYGGPRYRHYFDDVNYAIQRYPTTGGEFNALLIPRETGLITVEADPVDPLGIATKQYVDAHAGGGGSTAWADITGKPATFPPSTHSHPQSEVTNLVADLGLKAPLASPTFTGDPKSVTPATADNDTSIATTAFVKAQSYLTTTTASTTYAPINAPTLLVMRKR